MQKALIVYNHEWLIPGASLSQTLKEYNKHTSGLSDWSEKSKLISLTLDQLNKYLADGWVVISSNPMGGASLVIIEKGMTQDEIEQYKKIMR